MLSVCAAEGASPRRLASGVPAAAQACVRQLQRAADEEEGGAGGEDFVADHWQCQHCTAASPLEVETCPVCALGTRAEAEAASKA